MVDFERIAGFDWDAANSAKSIDKHEVSSIEAEQVFTNEPLVVVADPKHSATEPRWHELGKTHAGRFLHVTFTLRFDGTRIRVISARDMHRKEGRRYEQET
jgi:uncharacterized DUF497 family protein